MKNKNANPLTVLLCLCAAAYFLLCGGSSFAQESPGAEAPELAADNGTRPLVIYYSRTGKAKMLATALKNQLGCDLEAIVSNEKRGVGGIFLDQIFNLKDDQQPFAKEIQKYNPVVLVAPIWLLRLSSPARTFIKSGILKGKEVYIFTTSGGPMSSRNKSIAGFAAEYGLNVKGVFNIFKVGKKAQEDFDKDVKAVLEKTPIKSAGR